MSRLKIESNPKEVAMANKAGSKPSRKTSASKPKAKAAVKPKFSKSGVLTRVLEALLLGALIWTALYLLNKVQWGEVSSVPSPIAPTATARGVLLTEAEAEPASPTAEVAVLYQLRVETQQLVNAARGTWGPIAEIGIYLTPFQNGDSQPDFSRPGTLRQETALETTIDDVRVALTTFAAPTGLYWVAVDETTLPSGCAVWVPVLEADAADEIALSSWKIVGIRLNGDDTATVAKFQIVCGLPVSPSATPVPPTRTPPTEPPRETPTTPPPTPTTPPPTPTDSCGPDCLPPLTPVPTPTEYPPEVPTPTPVR